MALEVEDGAPGTKGMNRLGAVFDSIEMFLGMMMGMSGVLCSLATFNDTHEVKFKRERPGPRLVKKLHEIKRSTKPDRGGHYTQGLEAMRKLATTAVDIGVLLSDGCPTEVLIHNDSSPIDRAMDEMRAKMGSNWFLHTVGFGNFDTRYLKRLARQGRGDFHVNERLEVGKLRQIFMRLSAKVSTQRRTVMTFGEAALSERPRRELEPEGAWENSTPEQLQDMADSQWAWVMLPSKEPGKTDLEPQGDARRVRMHKKPFAQGALRYASHLFIEEGSKETSLHLVVKESKFEIGSNTPQAVHSAFLDNHRKAEELARTFNFELQMSDDAAGGVGTEGRHERPNLKFVPAYVIQLSDASQGSAFRYVTAERYIPGQYIKFNGNDGYVEENVDRDIGGTVAAFSHFTFDHTDGKELCVDIQGVGYTWTDPQLHSLAQQFGPADLGAEGMRCFFRTHSCSELCCRMQLRKVDAESLKLGDPLSSEDPCLEKKICLVCMEGDRVAVCQPCGHLCFCATCLANGTVAAMKDCPVCRKEIASTTKIRPGFRPPSTFVKEVAAR